ncbi:MAG: DUF4338 domain-containing protein [bacterium]|nr:MAG: DUF4338 domain-containing protein [bacterium]
MIIRGRQFSDSDINFIRETISNNHTLSRRKLSILICQKLNWRQANGNLKDRACRDVLLRLNKKGLIQLPQGRYQFNSQSIQIEPVHFIQPCYEIIGKLSDFTTPIFTVVQQKNERQLWNFLIDNYHYKGCRITVGRHLKYFVYLNKHLIGCFAFADAVLKLTARDQWIGWNQQQRETGLHLIINNVRFLILPWVKIKNLASKLLSLSAKIVPFNWQQFYHHRPLLMETFVEKQRFTGASYKAANWIYLGQTSGNGRSGMKYYYHGVIKDIYVYPLVKISLLRRTLTESRIMPCQ